MRTVLPNRLASGKAAVVTWLTSPWLTVALGLGWLTFGVLAFTTDSFSSGGLWLALGLLAIASGAARLFELRRGGRLGGVGGALAWLSSPLWGKHGRRPDA